jgi:hypothetical protein
MGWIHVAQNRDKWQALANMEISGFGGLGVSVLASGTQVRGFKPGQSRRIFKGGKILKHAFLRKVSKAVGPMSQICGR